MEGWGVAAGCHAMEKPRLSSVGLSELEKALRVRVNGSDERQ
jgi:hypothetical protein